MKAAGVISFGPCTIDPRTLELRRDGTLVPLEPLPTRILMRLASDPGSMVTREELLELGWPGTPWVAQQSLNTCIYQIRQALAGSGPGTVEIETLRGRGYRLSVRPTLTGDPRPRIATVHRWPAVVSLAFVAFAIAMVWMISARHTSSRPSAEIERILDRARYLARETQDLEAARAVLDSGRSTLPDVPALQAEWGELNMWLGDLAAAAHGAQRALELDPRSATAHRTLGVLAMLRSDWAGADAALQRALALDATDTRTFTALAFLRTIQGRFEDARRLIDESLRIDPLSATVHQDAGLAYLLMERYDDARRSCREVLRFRPRSIPATDCLFDVMSLMGRTDEAALWGRRLLELYGAPPLPRELPAGVVVARTEAWRLEGWADAVEQGAYPFGLALAYAANGRPDDAIEALQTAAERPRLGLLALAVDPRLAALRRHPTFRQLEARLRLPVVSLESSASRAAPVRPDQG